MSVKRVLLLAVVTDLHDVSVTYPSCNSCYCKLLLDSISNRYHCLRCGQCWTEGHVSWRYRLVLSVTDSSCVTHVVIFGRSLEPFFGKSASDFHKSVEDLDHKGYPCESMLADSLMKTFHGKYFYFGFKINNTDFKEGYAPTLKDVTPDLSDTVADWKDSQPSSDNVHGVAYQMLPANASVYTTVTDHMRYAVKAIRNHGRWTHELCSPVCQNRDTFQARTSDVSASESLHSFSSVRDCASLHDSLKFSFECSKEQTDLRKSFPGHCCSNLDGTIHLSHPNIYDNKLEKYRYDQSFTYHSECVDHYYESQSLDNTDQVRKQLTFQDHGSNEQSGIDKMIYSKNIDLKDITSQEMICHDSTKTTEKHLNFEDKIELKTDFCSKEKTLLETEEFDSRDDSLLLVAGDLMTQDISSHQSESLAKTDHVTVQYVDSMNMVSDNLKHGPQKSVDSAMKYHMNRKEDSTDDMLHKLSCKHRSCASCSEMSESDKKEDLNQGEVCDEVYIQLNKDCDLQLPDSEGFDTFFACDNGQLDDLPETMSVTTEMFRAKSENNKRSSSKENAEDADKTECKHNHFELLDTSSKLLDSESVTGPPCGHTNSTTKTSDTVSAHVHSLDVVLPDSEDLDEFLDNISDTLDNSKCRITEHLQSNNFLKPTTTTDDGKILIGKEHASNFCNELEEFLNETDLFDNDSFAVVSKDKNVNPLIDRLIDKSKEQNTDGLRDSNSAYENKQSRDASRPCEQISDIATSRLAECQSSVDSSGIGESMTDSHSEVCQEMIKKPLRTIMLSDSVLTDSLCSEDSDICYNSQPESTSQRPVNSGILWLFSKLQKSQVSDVTSTENAPDHKQIGVIEGKENDENRNQFSKLLSTVDDQYQLKEDPVIAEVENSGHYSIIPGTDTYACLLSKNTSYDNNNVITDASADLFEMSDSCGSQLEAGDNSIDIVANSSSCHASFSEPLDFSTPGCHDHAIAESQEISGHSVTGLEREACLPEKMGMMNEAAVRRVQFDRRLRRVSSCHLMDIKMRLTASPLLLHSPYIVTKSCLKQPLTVQVNVDKVSKEKGNLVSKAETFVPNNCLKELSVATTNTSSASAVDLFDDSQDLFSQDIVSKDCSRVSLDVENVCSSKSVSDDNRLTARSDVSDVKHKVRHGFDTPSNLSDNPFNDSSDDILIIAKMPSKCDDICYSNIASESIHNATADLFSVEKLSKDKHNIAVTVSHNVRVNIAAASTPDLFADESMNCTEHTKMSEGNVNIIDKKINPYRRARAGSNCSKENVKISSVTDKEASLHGRKLLPATKLIGTSLRVIAGNKGTGVHGLNLYKPLCDTHASPDLFDDSFNCSESMFSDWDVETSSGIQQKSRGLCKKLFS